VGYKTGVFRPCIDLKGGRVVQIVGGSLRDDGVGVVTRFESERPAAWYADLYRRDGLTGGHVIALGPGNESAAREALSAWPGGLQYGGGVSRDNAAEWLDAGASHVIVTSWLFPGGEWDEARLHALQKTVGRERLVLDLSCRRSPEGDYRVVTDRWQTFTSLRVGPETLATLGRECAELLVHGVDVEGLCQGIDEALVALLGEHAACPVTYAGGARSIDDLQRVTDLGRGRVDLTIGSALDIFGGSGVRYEDAVRFNRVRRGGMD
jgi:phosphoribosylformimino-5-aminoimidazole carboxamide ribotide isomerase